MSTTLTQPFDRSILNADKTTNTTRLMQRNLTTLVDLALTLKQAHWNVLGKNFRSVHLQLDEIIETVRAASDDVAERIVTLGVAADGRSQTVASASVLQNYPEAFLDVQETLKHIGDALETTIGLLRSAISELGELDPISEDMLIGISASLEKHLWMVQAQEQ
jgi:starvation-inducible DNA-binding protein